MFTQRKTNSYDLVGTNARNSDASYSSDMYKHYGENMIGRMSLEQFDEEVGQHLDQVFRPCKFQLQQPKAGSHHEDLVEQILHRKRSSNPNNSLSKPDSTSRSSDLFRQPESIIFGGACEFLPFELTKEQFDKYYFEQYEESTHDSNQTNPSKSQATSKFTLTPANSDLEEMCQNDDKLEKLMQDLAFIDKPLTAKRLRAKKNNKELTLSKAGSSSSQSEMSEEEKRRRKNKEQVKILQVEYTKNTNWTRGFMIELAKRTGLKPSQVYKWNWDQKKKEVEESKLKKLFYPNEIFQVLD
jgi:hypothetical protein